MSRESYPSNNPDASNIRYSYFKESREKMPTQIHFGTSGWRAIVADEFTLPNIRRAVVGIARYVSKQPGTHRILVGRDPRFHGRNVR